MTYFTTSRYSHYDNPYFKTEPGDEDHLNGPQWSGGCSPYGDGIQSPYGDKFREPLSPGPVSYTFSFTSGLDDGTYDAGTLDFKHYSQPSPTSATGSYQDSETFNSQRTASSDNGTAEYDYHHKDEGGSPYPQPAESPSASQDTKEQGFCCLFPNCNATIFKRKADLDRHYKHKHIPEAQQRAWRCDYPRCNRRSAEAPFRRKDHFRDHLRDFHKEDLGKRGKTITTDDYGRECNINNSWWRCPRCLIRVNVTNHGFQCPDCHSTCDDSRKRKRKHEPSPYGSRR